MYRVAPRYGGVNSGTISAIIVKLTFVNGFVDSRDRLINDSTRAQAHVPHFTIAHLTLGQSHVES